MSVSTTSPSTAPHADPPFPSPPSTLPGSQDLPLLLHPSPAHRGSARPCPPRLGGWAPYRLPFKLAGEHLVVLGREGLDGLLLGAHGEEWLRGSGEGEQVLGPGSGRGQPQKCPPGQQHQPPPAALHPLGSPEARLSGRSGQQEPQPHPAEGLSIPPTQGHVRRQAQPGNPRVRALTLLLDQPACLSAAKRRPGIPSPWPDSLSHQGGV